MNFYPRPPRGGRLTMQEYYNKEEQFLSTPSARRATGAHRHSGRYDSISIHALREEGDVCSNSMDVTALVFLSTPSARRATWYGLLPVYL